MFGFLSLLGALGTFGLFGFLDFLFDDDDFGDGGGIGAWWQDLGD